MMKRTGVDTRKRIEPNVVDNERPRGPLTDEEIAAVRRAYENGCRGEVIIGMRGDERIITMLVPDVADMPVCRGVPRTREELKRIGCDGMYRVRGAGNTDTV
jgi:uncharacterized protein (UPF0218 family)